jgi:D-alanyl-lipoteichoic acid acyltransferase DltB (MBOAT superfamily)
MLFPTLQYALFLTLILALVWSMPTLATRKLVLVAASYFFYAQWSALFSLLLAGSSLTNFAVGLALERWPERRRALLTVGIGLNLTLLGVFKYYNFFLESLADLLLVIGWQRDLPFLSIILPVGISFFTFHGISYIVDISRGTIRATRNPLDVLLYLAFFPQLVAGPIVRAAQFLPQLQRMPRFSDVQVGAALLLILLGLVKKVIIADALATHLVDPVFNSPITASGPDLWAAAYGYAVQIYCDFSAYSDIAMGSAALLGYRFPLNFNRPYRADSFSDFWRRWHISLSSWLRDYLYIPLGGNRGGALATTRNLMVTMLLGGLWHGAAWTFVLWGLLHGTALGLERWAGQAWRAVPQALRIGIVFHTVCAAWILFRSTDLTGAADYGHGLLFGGFEGAEALLTWPLAALIALVLAAQFTPESVTTRLARGLDRLPWWGLGLGLGSALLLIEGLGPQGVAPFIYFQF